MLFGFAEKIKTYTNTQTHAETHHEEELWTSCAVAFAYDLLFPSHVAQCQSTVAERNKQLNCVSNNHFLATLAPEHFLALTDAMQVRL